MEKDLFGPGRQPPEGGGLRAPRREAWILGGILGAAAWIRLSRLDLVMFLGDQAQNAFLALDLVGRGEVAAVALRNSQGVLSPPGFIWLVEALVLVSSHPLWLTGAVAALNVAGVYLVYLLGRDLGGRRVGLGTAALVACGPFAAQYSRSLWAPDALVPATAATALSLLVALRGGRGGWLVLSGVLLAWSVQVHPFGLAFAAAWLLAAACGMTWRLAPALAGGALGGGLLLLPFLAWQATHGWKDVPLHLAVDPRHAPGSALAWTLDLQTTRGFSDYFLGPFGPGFEAGLGPLAAATRVAGGLVTAALLLGVFLHLGEAAKRWRASGDRAALACDVFPLAWLTFPALALEASPVVVHPHYLVVSLPVQAWFTARGLVGWDPRPRWGHLAQGLALAAVCAVHLAWFASFNRYLEIHPWRAAGDFTTCWRHQQATARTLLEQGPEGVRRLRATSWGRYLHEHGGLQRATVPTP